MISYLNYADIILLSAISLRIDLAVLIKKAFKFRIYPNKAQRALLNKTFGCCRFIYNSMLTERQEIYEQYKHDCETLNSYQYKTEKAYKNNFEFLREVDSIALQQSRIHLTDAFKNFFRSPHVSYPKFKTKKSRQAYSTCNVNHNIRIDFDKHTIKLPKIKTPIKYRDPRRFDEVIRSATISKTKTGKYYVSILIERELPVKTKQVIFKEKINAFDMSAPAFLINETEKFENQRFYRKMEKQIIRLHRKLSRKQQGSNNQRKTRLSLARLYEKIFHRRLNWTHKTTFSLSRDYDAIILEDLNINGMQQFNSGLSKSITLDFSWHKFVTLLKYKLEWQGKHLVLIDRFFPSSKKCAKCGDVNQDLAMKERKWQCATCGTIHERDQNAAVNIRTEGFRILTDELNVQIISIQTTAGIAESDASGENVRLLPKQFSANEESAPFKER